KIIKLENVKYDNNYLYFCGLESCAYDSYEDLKARQVYEIHFKGLGDSCIAQKEDAIKTGEAISAGEGIDVNLPRTQSQIKQRETITVEYTLPSTSSSGGSSQTTTHTLSIDITPICYDDDDCKILNAHFKKAKEESVNSNKDDVILEFTIESKNSKLYNKNPDACLMGAAQILFKGSGVKEDYNILCNEDSKDKYDFIDGKCKKCEKNEKNFIWKESNQNCVYFKCIPSLDNSPNCCAASLINRKIIVDTRCYECQPYNNYYGIWKDSTDCNLCGEIKDEKKDSSEKQ
ncbi:MAG: hypothetical protein QW757_05190, partial [Candidatus Woesearchaeota archaeon]